MDEKIKILTKSILAVEGNDECNFFQALLKNIKFESIQYNQYIKKMEKNPNFSLSDNVVQLIDIGGKDKFKNEFEILSILEGFSSIEKIGFVRDAEKNPAEAAFKSICTTLGDSQIPIPPAPSKVRKDAKPNAGIFIMPDNFGKGMLENLCLKTIDVLPLYSCVDEFISCFSRYQSPEEINIFNEPKARVQSYLATRSPIINSLGLAALKGYWDFENEALDDLKNFLRDLFGAEGQS